MNLSEALKSKEEKILALWIERTLDSYASSSFFKKSLDRFANPVGMNIREGLIQLFQLIAAGANPQDFARPLDQVIRIRAVQDFTPAQAVAPILELKWAARQIFSADKDCRALLPELAPFDCDVDRAALQAFDLYMECREQLHRARIQELKSGRHVLTDAGCISGRLREDNVREAAQNDAVKA